MSDEQPRQRRRWLAGLGLGMILLLLLALAPLGYWTMVQFGMGMPRGLPVSAGQIKPSQLAIEDIPPAYLALYEAAGQRFDVPWPILAGIGKVETDHGRSTLPGVHGGANFAGAEGPMQFEQATFAAYAVDGNGDGRADPYDPADAIYTAAHMLAADGAGGNAIEAAIRGAIYAYNHLWSYVEEVVSWAQKYTGSVVDQVGAFQQLAQVIADVTKTALHGFTIATGPLYQPVFAGVPAGGLVRSGVSGNCTWWVSYNVLVPSAQMGDGAAWISTYRGLGKQVVEYEQEQDGNAGGWVQPASQRQVPPVGSIVSWDRGLSGAHGYGHVAVVIASDPQARQFEVSEMNWQGLGVVDQRTVSMSDPNLLGFVPPQPGVA